MWGIYDTKIALISLSFKSLPILCNFFSEIQKIQRKSLKMPKFFLSPIFLIFLLTSSIHDAHGCDQCCCWCWSQVCPVADAMRKQMQTDQLKAQPPSALHLQMEAPKSHRIHRFEGNQFASQFSGNSHIFLSITFQSLKSHLTCCVIR